LYCRFCTRKRRDRTEYDTITEKNFKKAIVYIKEHREVRDVILSGGDPLMLSTERLEYFLKKLKAIDHIEIIRIGTRAPCVYPMRVDEQLCTMLKKYHPLYINVHFNHPAEITPESTKACEMLADAGIPLGNQSVLLKGVNDDPKIMKELVLELLKIRVRPYYIYMPDFIRGTYHFRTSIDTGLKIIDSIRGWTSGMAVPHLVIDIAGGGGKIPILPGYLVSKEGKNYVFRNYQGKHFKYADI
jgi:lysine 2,3-aminomutase